MSERAQLSPVIAIYGQHGDAYRHHIDRWKDETTKMLRANPNKKVLVPIEDGNKKRSDVANGIRAIVGEGLLLPSDAYVYANKTPYVGTNGVAILNADIAMLGKRSLVNRLRNVRQHGLTGYAFLDKQYAALDELAADPEFARRLDVAPEPVFKGASAKLDALHSHIEYALARATKSGIFVGKRWSSLLQNWHDGNKVRNDAFVHTVDYGVAPLDTAGAVMLLGEGHAAVSQDLADDGYDVTTIFPDQEGDVYLLAPIPDALAKKHELDDWDEFVYGENESKILLGQAVIYRALSRVHENRRDSIDDNLREKALSEQAVRKLVYDRTDSWQVSDVDAFGEAIQAKGFGRAMMERMDGPEPGPIEKMPAHYYAKTGKVAPTEYPVLPPQAPTVSPDAQPKGPSEEEQEQARLRTAEAARAREAISTVGLSKKEQQIMELLIQAHEQGRFYDYEAMQRVLDGTRRNAAITHIKGILKRADVGVLIGGSLGQKRRGWPIHLVVEEPGWKERNPDRLKTPAELRQDRLEKAEAYLRANPGATYDEIAQALDCSLTWVSNYARDMKSTGQVRLEDKRSPVNPRYFATGVHWVEPSADEPGLHLGGGDNETTRRNHPGGGISTGQEELLFHQDPQNHIWRRRR